MVGWLAKWRQPEPQTRNPKSEALNSKPKLKHPILLLTLKLLHDRSVYGVLIGLLAADLQRKADHEHGPYIYIYISISLSLSPP